MKIESGSANSVFVQQQLSAKAQPVKDQTESQGVVQDNFKTTQNQTMLDLLHNQPEVRPEVLEKAKQIAQDPNYPPANVIEGLAKLFVQDATKG